MYPVVRCAILVVMARPVRVVSSPCPDCALCSPGNAFQGFGRNLGRASANLATLGVSALARRHCRACEHPLSEHHDPARFGPAPSNVRNGQITFREAAYALQQPVAAPHQPPGIAPRPVTTAPPGWYPAEAGRLRWWDGQQWTNHYARPQDAPR
jgi:hypothetical protein